MIKKRLLIVCEAFGGGVFAYVSQLCNDMCDDFDVYLAYAVRPQTPKNYKESIDSRIHLIEVNNFGGSILNPVKDIKVIKELRAIQREVKPDIIHLHSSVAGGIGRLAFHSCKDYHLVYTPHGYAHILMGRPSAPKCIMYKMFEKILGHRNCITLTCCESEDEVARTLTRRTAYVETGVNLDDLHTTIDPIEPTLSEKFTVYGMGRLCTQKQPALFNEIARLVPEARFMWIGTGELQHQLTAQNIEITGWKPRHEAIAMGKGAQIYVLCSLGEAIAMSLIENMYIGKLCLVSDAMGNKSVIKDSVNGYVCKTAENYAKRIKEAMKHFPQDLAEQGRKDVLNHYNTKRMKKDYIQFYSKVINGQFDK